LQHKYQNNPHLLSCIIAGWYAFDKYYNLTDDSPAYAAAIILHPSRRKQYILRNWKKSWHKKAFTDVKKLWEAEYKNIEVSNTSYTGPTTEPDEFDLMARELDVTTGPTVIEDEYEDFAENSPHAITRTALDWWLEDAQRTKYPRLSQMAIDILSIPAMSAEPERVFSGARRTISWDRSQLGANTIMKMECLKSWYRSHITKGRKVAAIDELLDAQDEGTEGSETQSTSILSRMSW
jgi:hypothetical protein